MKLARRILSAVLAMSMVVGPPMRASAEDIDLFVGGTTTAENPNVLIVIDNSANWANQAQHWPSIFQGQAELKALSLILSESTVGNNLNMGLMMLTGGVGNDSTGFQNKDGGFVRFAIRQMTPANKDAFRELIMGRTPPGLPLTGVINANGDACVDGTNSVATSTRNCIYKNATGQGGTAALNESVGTNVDYSATMFEVFKYFGGYTSPANASTDTPGTPVNRSHFGPTRYSGNEDPGGDSGGREDRYDSAAFANAADLFRTTYNPPISPTNSCAKNYVIFIGNGFPTQDSPASLLSEVGGTTTQQRMPVLSSTTNNVVTDLGVRNVCESNNSCVAAAQAAAAANGQTFDSYSCSGGAVGSTTNLGTDGTCESASACASRAQTDFPGFSSYSCTGGTAQGGSVNIGTDTTCESPTDCLKRAQTLSPGLTTYSCTGGTTQSASTTNLGAVTTICETAKDCATRAGTLFSGFSSYSCSGGSASTPTQNLEPSTAICETTNDCKARAATAYPGYGSYDCTGGTGTGCSGSAKINQLMTGVLTSCSGQNLVSQQMQGTTAACSSPNLINQAMSGTNACLASQTMQGTTNCSGSNLIGRTMHGTNQVISVTAVPNQFAVPGSEARFADEWAMFLNTTDVSSAPGRQNVTTFTIDVFKDAQDARQTALLFNMAKLGGGEYFQATSESAIIDALRQILIKIQSTNSVFAAASLPINATNRTQNENQVFIGMFRPDANARPRWYGNLKRYQIARIAGQIRLADADGQDALSPITGFVAPCARSFWTTDSGTYWGFSPESAGTCTTSGTSVFSDSPDGPSVEKGATAEVVRKGNNPPTTDTVPTFQVARNLHTCSNVAGTTTCNFGSAMHTFDSTNVDQAAMGAADAAEHTALIDYSRGVDVNDENANTSGVDTRPSLHGDIVHSRPLPVNYGGTTGVVMYYGSNDGTFRAVQASDGKELWAFFAPEQHSRLKRLRDNSPQILYPTMVAPFPSPMPTRKEYFFDGSVGLFQTLNNTQVWIYPSMRRGGRMLYGFDVTNPTTPLMKWRAGCPNLGNDTDCTGGLTNIGQTWSIPSVAKVKGFDLNVPVVITGGGYDSCDDTDSGTTTCVTPKGSNVYVFNGNDGTVLKNFGTGGTGSILRSVPADVALVDRDFDGYVDHGYFADTGGNLYRIDFVDPGTLAARAPAAWTVTRIAYTTGSGRKFLFSPGLLPTAGKVLVTITSGDRERPLQANYPYQESIQNRAYMFIDTFSGTAINIDDETLMDNFTTNTTCSSVLGVNSNGWFFDLVNGRGEQGVTSTTIFGGLVLFSTNMPDVTNTNACTNNLGKAFGYAVNVLNASGAIGTQGLCGGTSRSNEFIGGGLPPSPVTGRVPVDGKMEDIVIGGANRDGGGNSLTIGAQQIKPSITQKRQRVYWYRSGDK